MQQQLGSLETTLTSKQARIKNKKNNISIMNLFQFIPLFQM